MIDLHSHIIFGVDDGPDTLEESLQLIEMAYKQGVRHIIATSHRRKSLFDVKEEQVYQHYLKLVEEVKVRYPDLLLGYGGEIYYGEHTQFDIESLIPINQTRYLLLEMSPRVSWKAMQEGLNQVLLEGYWPILAHIERYDVLERNKNRVEQVLAMGAYTQVNSGSVLKAKLFSDKERKFKKRAKYFLEADLVNLIASDMHDLKKRPPSMKEAYKLIEQSYGQAYAQQLFVENPTSIIKNREIIQVRRR